MLTWKKSLVFSLLITCPTISYAACASTWTGGVSGEWNDIGNWDLCIPGLLSSDTDTAIFGSVVGNGPTISLDTPAIDPGLSHLFFDNSTTAFTITTGATQSLFFNGDNTSIFLLSGSHNIDAPIELDTSLLSISVNDPGATLTLTDAITDTFSSSVNFIGPGSVLNFENLFHIGGSFTFSSGTVTNENTSAQAVAEGSTLAADASALIAGSHLLNTNSGNISGTGVGSGFFISGLVELSSGSLTNINSGTIDGGTGSDVNCGLFVLQGGTFISSNSGNLAMSGQFGTHVVSSFSFSINEGSCTNSNSGTIDVGVGSSIEALAFSLDKGSFTNSNTGTVNAGIGSSITVNFFGLSIDGGTFINTNSGTVNMGTGALVSTIGDLNLSGGILKNFNTGTVAVGSFGALIQADEIGIDGGTFINDDTVLSDEIEVEEKGILTGKGIFNDTAQSSSIEITNSATVIPGGPEVSSSPGTMTIMGSYFQETLGNLVFNLFDPTSFSQLLVTGSLPFGTVELDGTLVTALSPGGFISPGITYNIIHTDNGVTGVFSQLTNFNIPNVVPRVIYLPNDVLLFFDPTVTNYIGGFRETLFSSVNHLNFRINRQMEYVRERFCFCVGPDGCIVAGPQNCCPWSIYAGATGDFGNVYTFKDQTGFGYWSAGALLGFDYAFSQVGLGIVLDYDHIEGKGVHRAGRFDVDKAHASFYVTYVPECARQFAVNGIAGGGYDWLEFHRRTGEQNQRIAKGSPNGYEYDFLLGVEYDLFANQIDDPCSCMQFVPLVSLQYIYLSVDGYKEKGADLFNMHIHRQSYESLRSTLGVRLNFTTQWCGVTFNPELNVGWQREFMDKTRHLRFSAIEFADVSGSLEMEEPGRNIGFGSIDLEAIFCDNYGLEASYTYEWNSLYHDNFFYLGFNVRF